MLGRKRDGGAAEGVVVPGVLRVGRGEEAFEVEPGGNPRHEGTGAIEKREETVPIDSKEEGMVGGEEGSAHGKWDATAVKVDDGEAHGGIGVRKFRDEDDLFRSCLRKNAKKVGLEKRLEAAFDGHPNGLRSQEILELVTARRVCDVIGERTDGRKQRLVDARTGFQARTGRDFGPRDLRSACGNLGVAGIPMRGAPGQLRGNPHEGMQNHKDALEAAVIGFQQRFTGWRISKLFRLH